MTLALNRFPKNVRRKLALALAVPICLLFAPILCRAAAQITTSTTSVFASGSKFYSHSANGYYWVALRDGSSILLFSSRDAVTWASQGAIFSFYPGFNDWAVRFSLNTVIAFGFNSGDNIRYYSKGTLNSSGTVTWDVGEVATGVADATWTELNASIANGKPIFWRAGPTNADSGKLTIGDQLDSPVVWGDTANAPSLGPAVIGGNGTDGRYSAGAVLPIGSSDPDDLIVLRATTTDPYTAGSHRLVAIKYDAGGAGFDTEWYNVSTRGGILAEDASNEVRTAADDEIANRRFAAVRDSNGDIHAVYVNVNRRIAHYRKTVGFNDSWAQISTDVAQSDSIDKVGLTALAGGHLLMHYERTSSLYARRFDGTSWGPEQLIYVATDLRRSFGAMESSGDCAPGIAFTEGLLSPFAVNFSLSSDCGDLRTEEGTGTLTVSSPGRFEMTFDEAFGGAIELFYDLAEDPSRTYDLAGNPTANFRGLFHSSMTSGSVLYTTGTNDLMAKADLLEATPTRVRVRQESFYQEVPPATSILAGVKGIGDYSIYSTGETAVHWNRKTTKSVPQEDHPLEIGFRREASPDPRDNWTGYSESGTTFPAPFDDAFVLAQSEVAGVRTDFLAVLYEAWPLAEQLDLQPATAFFSWRDTTDFTLASGLDESWDFLLYFKPTDFVDNTDPEVTARSADYRLPDTLTINAGKGAPWLDVDEHTSAGDFFNESEAAYALEISPSLGLDFDIDGSIANPRYRPFFKIRQWRSFADPSSVTLEGNSLANGIDFHADVKPISRSHFSQDLQWHSTMQSSGAVTSPDVGSAGTVTLADFVPGRYASGARFDADGEFITISASANFDPNRGSVEFWYQPNYDFGSGAAAEDHGFFGYWIDSNNFFYALHQPYLGGAGNLEGVYFQVGSGGMISEAITGTGPSFPVLWRATEWVHLRFAWDVATSRLEIYVNGELRASAAYTAAPALPGNDLFYIGERNRNNNPINNATGIIDEFRIYSDPDAPTGLAFAGLTSNADEYFASPTDNFPLDFEPLDLSGRGRYLYLGSDSKFRGLNIALAQVGTGVAPGDLVWEYWNGTTGEWDDLESVLNFTDETDSLTKPHGTVYWEADPPNWSEYSVNGGPDLYYVRTHLVNGASYDDPPPTEALIKTDILLFQYCGDITSAAQTFIFDVPLATAVELMSFTATAGDGEALLEWQTASELNNLGFHLYRSLSEDGPYERITASVIPGLGSSPEGARYSYRDSGLTHGATYYYKLEDIETTGATGLHGPVSATSTAELVTGGGSGGEAEETVEEEATETPSRITYGNPSANDFRVRRRGKRWMELELITSGFYAIPQDDGSVMLEVPGFEDFGDGESPDVPTYRSWQDVVPGRDVSLVSVKTFEVAEFASLRPSESELMVVASGEGTVEAGRRLKKRRQRHAYYPESWAELLSVGFQGAAKKAFVEMAPLRWDATAERLVLARRLVVRLSLRGRDRAEWKLGKSHHEVDSHAERDVLARLAVTEPGLYGVPFESVFGQRGRPLRTSELRLSRQGEPVAFFVSPNPNRFKRNSMLYFLSEGASLSPYGDEAVYELEASGEGLQMEALDGTPSGSATSFYWKTVSREENRLYQPTFEGEEDVWQWDWIFGLMTKSYPFELTHLAAVPETSQIRVWLHGASDFPEEPDHHVRLYVNGTLVTETWWDGETAHFVEAELGPGVLREGENTLAIEDVGDTEALYSMVMLDRFEVHHPAELVAEDGQLKGQFSETGVAAVVTSPAQIFDLTSPQPKRLTGAAAVPEGMSFRVESGHRYLLTDSAKTPEVRPANATGLKQAWNRAEYLVIGPRELLPAAAPLLAHRRGEGLIAGAIATEDIYEEFGYGEATPESMKDFLSYAYHHWREPSLKYVLLLGDGTYDPKDYLGTGLETQVPVKSLKTQFLWTASDPWLGAINGEDILPDVAIGRLPAASPEEVELLVQKILNYESAERDPKAPFILVTDNPDKAGDFNADAEELASTILSGQSVEKIYLSEKGTAATRSAIVQAFDEGASLISYMGHGAIHLWANENLFNIWQVDSLSAQSQQPLLFTMNCLNGYFHFPYHNSLAEELLKAEAKGVIAAFSPTGLSLNEAAHRFHKVLLQQILNHQHERLGDAILAGQAAYAQTGALPELLSIYHLLGDPALRLR